MVVKFLCAVENSFTHILRSIAPIFMIFCDSTQSILKWASEEIIIPYFYSIDKKVHKYYVDFIMQLKENDGSLKTYMIEIKPYIQTIEPKKRKCTKKYIK